MHKQKIISYVLLFIIIIGTSSLLGVIRINQELPKTADELLMKGENIQIKQFNNTGKIKYKINALSFKDITPKKTIIQKPISIFYNSRQNPLWHIKGDTGYIYNQHDKSKETLSLISNVILTKTNQDQNPIQLTTNQIDFFKNNGIAYTKSPVAITEINTNNKTTANGLIYSNYLEEFYLLNNIKTYYEPEKNKIKNNNTATTTTTTLITPGN